MHRDAAASVSLDQLLALNDEMAALVRAGIPLEQGLTQLGHEAPGKLGLLASRLADRMKAGESLADILEKDDRMFPPVWRSVVLAGMRSGHLAAALESLSRTGRRAKELRRSMAVALIYPAFVVTLAYLLFVFSVTMLVPVITRAYVAITDDTSPLLDAITHVGRTIGVWGLPIPVVVALGFAWWWYRTGRAMRTFRGGKGGRRFLFGRHRQRRFPSVIQALVDGRMATFAELLELLDEHEVPLPKAIVLAADASGDRALIQASRTIAQRLENGETIQRREELPMAFPPLLGWSIVSGMGQSGLQRTLATSAEMYRQRALDAARWATDFMPMILTVFVGGAAVLFQALIVFLPFVSLLYRLGAPPGS